MYRYIESASIDNSPKSFGYGPVMKYDGERIRRTNLTTNIRTGRCIVYEDVDKTDTEGNKKLYYKWRNGLHGTFYCYCFDPEHPDREYIPADESDMGIGYYK